MDNDKKSERKNQVEKKKLYQSLTSRKSKEATDQLFTVDEDELSNAFQPDNDDDK